jgi:hypothetical protein
MVDTHEFSLQSARQAAERDQLGRWVADFLASPGSDNAVLAEQLTEQSLSWLGPVSLPLKRLHRLAGPEGEPVLCVVDDEYWRDDVEEMKEEIADGWEPPPLVVSYRNDKLVLEDGNHRVESLRRAGEREGWAVIGFENDEERDRFMASLAE